MAMFQLMFISLVLQLAFSEGFKIQPRIVNGTLSITSDFPYFVNIVRAVSNSKCSGALISDRYISCTFYSFAMNNWEIYWKRHPLVRLPEGYF